MNFEDLEISNSLRQDYDSDEENSNLEGQGQETLDNSAFVNNLVHEAAKRAAKRSERAPRNTGPKLSPELLLGDRGFKKLREMMTKSFSMTDDHVNDLDQIMIILQEWEHFMYPKFKFRDFIDKVERNCKTTTMKAYLTLLKEQGEGFDEAIYNADQELERAKNALDMPVES